VNNNNNNTNPKRELSALINERIRAPKVQLIDQDGENVGIVSQREALQKAIDANLDLVMIAERGKEGVPVTKIMDFGKSLYEKKKKQNEAKKHQKVIQVKEIKLSPKIGEHDYQTKIKQAVDFLKEGKRVKITVFFRGRENATKHERGPQLFAKVEQSFNDNGFANNLAREGESAMGSTWSRIYYLK